MVELDVHLLRSSVYGTRVPLATLPERYRPSVTQEIELASLDANSSVGSVVAVIEPDGAMDVSTSLPGARWLVGSACFLVG